MTYQHRVFVAGGAPACEGWIGSAVVPTLVANAFFVPRYLLPEVEAPAAPATIPSAVAISEREG